MSRIILTVALLGLVSCSAASGQAAHSVAAKVNAKGHVHGVAGRRTADEIRTLIVNWKEMAAAHYFTRKPSMPDFSSSRKGT